MLEALLAGSPIDGWFLSPQSVTSSTPQQLAAPDELAEIVSRFTSLLTELGTGQGQETKARKNESDVASAPAGPSRRNSSKPGGPSQPIGLSSAAIVLPELRLSMPVGVSVPEPEPEVAMPASLGNNDQPPREQFLSIEPPSAAATGEDGGSHADSPALGSRSATPTPLCDSSAKEKPPGEVPPGEKPPEEEQGEDLAAIEPRPVQPPAPSLQLPRSLDLPGMNLAPITPLIVPAPVHAVRPERQTGSMGAAVSIRPPQPGHELRSERPKTADANQPAGPFQWQEPPTGSSSASLGAGPSERQPNPGEIVFGLRLADQGNLRPSHSGDGGTAQEDLPASQTPPALHAASRPAELKSLEAAREHDGEPFGAGPEPGRPPESGRYPSISLPILFATQPADDPSRPAVEAEMVWSHLDAGALQPDTPAEAPAQPLTTIDLAAPGHEQVSVRVLEMGGGLEVQVTTRDGEARQHLLGGLNELMTKVHDLSLGTVIPGLDQPVPGDDLAGGHRQQQQPGRPERQPRARRAGTAFVLPVDAVSGPPSNTAISLN